jgi:hypothetical protein
MIPAGPGWFTGPADTYLVLMFYIVNKKKTNR